MKDIQYKDYWKLGIFSDIGAESVIYRYRDTTNYKKTVLLKYFRDNIENKLQVIRNKDNGIITENDYKVLTKEELERKKQKLELLTKRDSLKDEIEIYDRIFIKDKFKGYTMEFSDFKPLNVVDARKKDKIKYLKLIREKIELLNEDGIYIGDFHESNFLTCHDVSKVKLCDLDNLRIDNFDFDSKHKFALEYEKSDAKKEYIDSYCFNMFTIAYLNKIAIQYFLLKDNKLPRALRTKKNMEIYESMLHLDSTYQPKYLIDNIR